jgi:hypothetical protein
VDDALSSVDSCAHIHDVPNALAVFYHPQQGNHDSNDHIRAVDSLSEDVIEYFRKLAQQLPPFQRLQLVACLLLQHEHLLMF